ncbi:hypothetical protein TomTYG75_34320 [Sphingobium sp. TomTYG75]|jgi:hypothetical protein
MRFLILAAAALSLATPALAETAATAKYTSADTELGVLLDNPAAKAIVEKYIPGMTSNDQVDMARAMTLKAIQQYAPDDVTDARLAAIDADLSKLP